MFPERGRPSVEDTSHARAILQAVEGELGYLGGATIYSDGRKIDADVRMFFATDSSGVACRWWGSYEIRGRDPGASVSTGDALMRFGGTEYGVRIDAASSTAGRFEVTGTPRDLTQQG